jgi:hypothetical protein
VNANIITDCLGIQFTSYDQCDDNCERWVEARVQALLAAVDNKPPERVRPYDIEILKKFP